MVRMLGSEIGLPMTALGRYGSPGCVDTVVGE
jgi:hypothetical protein